MNHPQKSMGKEKQYTLEQEQARFIKPLDQIIKHFETHIANSNNFGCCFHRDPHTSLPRCSQQTPVMKIVIPS